MRILIVAATREEIMLLISDFGFSISELNNGYYKSEILHPTSDILVTGVGMVATAFALGKHLAAHQYDLVINLGIAGSFARNIALGDVVEISEDAFSELGAENGDNFLPISDMGFGVGIYYPSAKLSNYYNSSKPSNTFNPDSATAITVNTVHGNEIAIKNVVERLNPQLESMEGAAFFYACRQINVPCLQIRAVSNYVEKRNRDNWKIGLAIKNLNNFAIEFLKQLQVKS